MSLRPRIMPTLLLKEDALVKTIKFSKPNYLGDPINALKIFNGKGVDEVCILDIDASYKKKEPNFGYLKDIASEAFMPLSYGGGITNLNQIKEIFYIGYEKVIINSSFIENPNLIKEAANFAGSQSIVVSIDYKKNLFGQRFCYSHGGKAKQKIGPVELAVKAQEYGAGEIFLNSIDRDGTMQGYDIEIIKEVVDALTIPVTACGGAKNVADIKKVLLEGKAHAAAAGSMFVYYGPHKAVLINVPSEKDLFDNNIY
ncbi:cyclase [Planococcus glaciei]|uniref:AglZ/HisF2 family acetamidino modification protein n=1 Tax=Planococcus glaciei TaxID=459472 RepID=UPI00088F32AD|nr:AglZ/HisF2 family acetamidino modification protein [Planococcus glaciei]SDH87212.1 cyclase [Planococcus glaciei]